LHNHGSRARKKKGRKMEDKVLAAMRKVGKPVRPGDVAKMLGMESKEVSKAINALKKTGKVISPKRCYYSVEE
jgi:biotin operon repressor